MVLKQTNNATVEERKKKEKKKRKKKKVALYITSVKESFFDLNQDFSKWFIEMSRGEKSIGFTRGDFTNMHL